MGARGAAMSLPVGTLVLIVRSKIAKGRVGTITHPLGRYLSCSHGWVTAYALHIPGVPGYGPMGDVWLCDPTQIVPITPPGRTDDVTTDEPIREVA